MFWGLFMLAVARVTNTTPRKQDMRYAWSKKR